MMIRVWFNHWFSTAYHLIRLIKEANPNTFMFIGSNKNEYAIYKTVCDEWYTEPKHATDGGYARHCMHFCSQHQVDVFVPYRHLTAISAEVNQLKKIGVRTLCSENFHLMEILDDKVKTYEYMTRIGLDDIVPEYKIVKSMEDFAAAYKELKKTDNRVCYKLVQDEGAATFRVIDNSIEHRNAMYNMPSMKVTYAAAEKIVSDYDFYIPIILMPYLSGQEVSVDCLATKKGNIIIPRFKTNHRYSEIRFDPEIIHIANRIMQNLDMNVPLNIQFRFHNERPYLLEINPRMSGGLQLSCLGTGINIPDIAMNQLLGIEKDWNYPKRLSCRVAHIETPICLDV